MQKGVPFHGLPLVPISYSLCTFRLGLTPQQKDFHLYISLPFPAFAFKVKASEQYRVQLSQT